MIIICLKKKRLISGQKNNNKNNGNGNGNGNNKNKKNKWYGPSYQPSWWNPEDVIDNKIGEFSYVGSNCKYLLLLLLFGDGKN